MNRPSNRNQPKPLSVASGASGKLHQSEQDPDRLTMSCHGTPQRGDQHSLKGAQRCPTLLGDFLLREKIRRFDYERIQERGVHARGSASIGYFDLGASLGNYTCARVLTEAGMNTDLCAQLSTHAGGASSVDALRENPRSGSAVGLSRNAFRQLNAFGFTPEARPLLDPAWVVTYDSRVEITDGIEAFLERTRARQWKREPDIRASG